MQQAARYDAMMYEWPIKVLIFCGFKATRCSNIKMKTDKVNLFSLTPCYILSTAGYMQVNIQAENAHGAFDRISQITDTFRHRGLLPPDE